MGWKTAAAVLVVVFSVVLLQAMLADPIKTYQDGLNKSGNYTNDHFNGEETIQNVITSWFNMGWVLIFGIMGWGIYRAIRRELTRRGGL